VTSSSSSGALLNFAHLLALSGPLGTFEHADHTVPRRDQGYCCDDVARVAIVLLREPALDDTMRSQLDVSLGFLELAQRDDGSFQNRRDADGIFFGPANRDDCWGRSLWGAGSFATGNASAAQRARALELFERGIVAPSVHPRAMAFATLGAVEVLRADPSHEGARQLIATTADVLNLDDVSDEWRWGEDRLRYANASLAEALFATGAALHDDRMVVAGLRRLRWLIAEESIGDHFSVTPVGGRGPGDGRPGFDQQPIEVAAIADACARAYALTGDAAWLVAVERAVSWFLGNNDGGTSMIDVTSGGGYDGLTSSGPNLNQGAESTLALLSTLQHARHFDVSTP
jgi:hypothetical protein